MLNEATNDDVIRRFVLMDLPSKGSLKGNNVSVEHIENGWSFINYSTPLAYISKGDTSTLYFNSKKYSSTTSRIQSQLRSMASQQRMKVVECEPDEMYEMTLVDFSKIKETMHEFVVWVFESFNDREWSTKKKISIILQRVAEDL